MDLQLTSSTSVASPTPPTQEGLRQIVMSNSDGASRAVFDFNKHSLAASMRQLGASSVVVTYSGGGDEGRIDAISFFPPEVPAGDSSACVALMRYHWDPAAQCGATELAFEDMALPDVAEALCDFAVSSTGHNGYENGEGGSGTFTLQAADASAELEHSDYYTESDTSMHSL